MAYKFSFLFYFFYLTKSRKSGNGDAKKEGQADPYNRSNLPYVAYLQMIDKFCALHDGTHKLCASVFRSAAISGFFRMRISASWSVSCFGAADAAVSAVTASVSAAAFPE